jgi:hypothetical protein
MVKELLNFVNIKTIKKVNLSSFILSKLNNNYVLIINKCYILQMKLSPNKL